MLGLRNAFSSDRATLAALSQSLAIIEFDPSGKILTANVNFCKTMGYELPEIKGQHHSMFVDPHHVRSDEYKAFWAKLGRGEFDAQEYRRIAKGGREVWIQASYNPIKRSNGTVVKVVKQATDITAEKLRNAEFGAKLGAVSRVQAVIEFTPSGEIITANENFLNALGYRLDEVKGQQHRMFVEPAYAQSADYREFWQKLNAGEYVAAEFKRVGKGGKTVWIAASYNPVFDLNKKVVKVVKFATDITERVRAVTELAAGLTELADDNLEYRIEAGFMPSFERLRLDFNASLAKLQSTLVDMAESSDAIRAGTQELSTASQDLSRRTEQQAASLEETAAALDEITATVKKTAEGAAHARKVVSCAKDDAERSGEVVRKAVESMNAIETSSREIEQIIGVIDEIAFQTNLLALNAGVEAARAGDAGRGFAVVASEVRGLAQRSAGAAKEIKALISTSGRQVTEGVGLVGETGKALDRIVAQVSEISGIVTDMAASAGEQSTALQEVNTAINQMDQVTQQDAAMVEQSTAATVALSGETSKLSDLVGQFKVGRDQGSRGKRSGLHSVPGDVTPRAGRAGGATVVAMKQTGRGRAVRKATPDAATGEWEEF